MVYALEYESSRKAIQLCSSDVDRICPQSIDGDAPVLYSGKISSILIVGSGTGASSMGEVNRYPNVRISWGKRSQSVMP